MSYNPERFIRNWKRTAAIGLVAIAVIAITAAAVRWIG